MTKNNDKKNMGAFFYVAAKVLIQQFFMQGNVSNVMKCQRKSVLNIRALRTKSFFFL